MTGIALLAGALLSVTGAGEPASAAPFAQCSDSFNGGGQGANCTVTIENSLDLATGAMSATVTVLRCNGAANTVDTCPGPPTVQTFPHLIDDVDQCNGAVNGGGGTLHCRVIMINTIIGAGTTSAPSVNQCQGSFDSLPLPAGSACNPMEATSGATIDQCNNSMNGGTQVSMNCTVETATTDGPTVSAALPVTIDQCNGSAEGGGSKMVCSTMISTIFQPAAEDGDGGDGGTGGGDGGGDGTDGGDGGTGGGDGTGDGGDGGDGTGGGDGSTGGGTGGEASEGTAGDGTTGGASGPGTTGEELAATGPAEVRSALLAAALVLLSIGAVMRRPGRTTAA